MLFQLEIQHMQLIQRFKTLIILAFLFATFFGLSSIFIARGVIQNSSNEVVSSNLQALPETDVALVLGCSRYLSNGRQNLFFKYRMDAAAEIFSTGKVQYLLVSGDNHTHSYNEPQDMKDALIERGVPESRIICDYAGFRTLDSVVRAKEIFGQDRLIIISQEFHNRRAVFIGQSKEMEVYGYNARDVDSFNSLKTNLREELARVKTVLDVWVLRKQPKFLGDQIRIAQNS